MTRPRDTSWWLAGMTLGQAAEMHRSGGWSCACIGAPPENPVGSPCWCRLTWGQVTKLRRAAQQVAQLTADLRRAREDAARRTALLRCLRDSLHWHIADRCHAEGVPVCFWHGPEPNQPGDFRACGECLHVWRTEADWTADVGQLAAAMGWDAVPYAELSACPLCAHDF